ncbi:deoxyribonuclease IV [Abyssisolibacter fermentans]|uniref:deoxyribonuclease IV n=1 Tax=Abyssisolibacter fermentans TaxID=1766203 RepID=UPI0008369277|nr:deoxyribonuclease IV [Abyssisolibacter fermentans]
MFKIGCHLSISKGYYKAGLQAVDINANTFQFFTRNPRGGKAKALDMDDINKFSELVKEHDFGVLFAHAPYTMNLSSDKEDIRDFAKSVLKDDLNRLKLFPKSYYIFHPGSHLKQGSDKGIEYIVEALNETLTEDNEITILLEGMAGKGTEIGRNMEELKKIIDGVKYNENLGICIDTCHLYSSGFDIVNDLNGVIDSIDKIIGFDRVKAVHLNDSKTEFASNKDRHELIGKGTIGMEAIVNIINHPYLRELPFNLETPNDVKGHKEEIEMLRTAYK